MMKRYISKTQISISVVLPEGGTTRVSFLPQTQGGSVLYTDDEGIQYGVEHHYKYGKSFKEDESFGKKKAPAKASAKGATPPQPSPQGEGAITLSGAEETTTLGEGATALPDSIEEGTEAAEETAEETAEEAAEPGLREVKVSDLGKAKDYLAENYGLQRTKLKTKEHIETAAVAYGIKFCYD